MTSISSGELGRYAVCTMVGATVSTLGHFLNLPCDWQATIAFVAGAVSVDVFHRWGEMQRNKARIPPLE